MALKMTKNTKKWQNMPKNDSRKKIDLQNQKGWNPKSVLKVPISRTLTKVALFYTFWHHFSSDFNFVFDLYVESDADSENGSTNALEPISTKLQPLVDKIKKIIFHRNPKYFFWFICRFLRWFLKWHWKCRKSAKKCRKMIIWKKIWPPK